MGYGILEIFHVYLVSLNDSLEDLEWFEKRKKRYSIRSLVGNNPLRKVCVCVRSGVCVTTQREGAYSCAVYRIDFDTILAKKKKRGEEEEEEVVGRNGEMESGPSFRRLVSIGGGELVGRRSAS